MNATETQQADDSSGYHVAYLLDSWCLQIQNIGFLLLKHQNHLRLRYHLRLRLRLGYCYARAQRRIETVKAESNAVRDRYEELEVKIRKFNAELSNYRFLDDFSKLLLGVEMPRGEKLRVVVSTLQLLEDSLNYLGLKGDAASIRVVKDNVFRNS